MRWAALSLLLLGCAHPEAQEYIGEATMAADRSVTLNLASRECDGTIAHGHFVYRPGDATYDEVVRHIGGLEPGQSKPVPPWPSPPCD
jgi:hypothetical protein